MDAATRAWLIAQLGTATDLTDLDTRYTRLSSARAVAIEVVRERLAALRAQPGSISVSGVVALNVGENIRAYERQLLELLSGQPPAPDDPAAVNADDSGFGVIRLVERPRR